MTSAVVASAPARPLTQRELGPADLDAVEALHRVAIGPIARPEVVKPESRAYFESILAGRGRTVGLCDGGALVAYGILQHEHTPKDGPHRLLNVAPSRAVGRLAGASVHPSYRGQGLQKALIAGRIDLAPADMLLFSTAAPVNVPSWSNLVAGGFPISGIELFFGGYARYVMVRDGSEPDDGARIVVDPLDTDRQKALFAEGWRGYGRGRSDTGATGLVLARPR
ncbi:MULTISPECIES: GNAT family N-acetyltransferase [unclassified Xanthobacter]|uniref:GNAT family N-acetyltransferase n=1 Tax=unclassified Xanthobacter TaxID=2623496 RepID=UPI001EE064A1|nr:MULTISPECIES: GNAT family N-acetyltransferase [unclassified Xanthobacter]